MLPQVGKNLKQFFPGFAEAEHQSGFGNDVGSKFFGHCQDAERAFVHGAGADLPVQARDGFKIVGQYPQRRGDHPLNAIGYAAKVGNEHFNTAGR